MTAPPDAPEEPDGPSERVEAVMEGLKKLAPDDRKLITMRHLNGSATFKEIAQELGISEGAARVRHHRILLDLKRLLEQDPRIQSLL
jgi:RNA polymerase sigma factor (sigma-70 family)